MDEQGRFRKVTEMSKAKRAQLDENTAARKAKKLKEEEQEENQRAWPLKNSNDR